MVHERRLEGSNQAMELRVSGAVLHGNLIMFDKKTNTRWLQETGKAIDAGVFGSPFYIIDGEPFWGADRLWMIRRWLKSGGW